MSDNLESKDGRSSSDVSFVSLKIYRWQLWSIWLSRRALQRGRLFWPRVCGSCFTSCHLYDQRKAGGTSLLLSWGLGADFKSFQSCFSLYKCNRRRESIISGSQVFAEKLTMRVWDIPIKEFSYRLQICDKCEVLVCGVLLIDR